MSVLTRNNVQVLGDGGPAIVFAHGFGCDQNMWRLMVPAFVRDFRVILIDLVGAGQSDLTAWSPDRYATLDGHADDIIDILRALDPGKVVFVGHSVSAMIGVRVARKAADLLSHLVMVGPSPRYIDDGAYTGGFEAADIDELLGFLDTNHLGWSEAMAPTIMGTPDRPELGDELTNSFCRTDPDIARHFARVTFTSDNRADLPHITIPTLILQCRDDVIAPEAVGRYVHHAIPGSRFVQLAATGHCPNLSAPDETAAAIRDFLGAVAGPAGETAAP